jgi:hypothetical protein
LKEGVKGMNSQNQELTRLRAIAVGCTPTAVVTDLNFRKKQTGDPNFGPPVKLFLRLLPAPRRSFHTGSRLASAMEIRSRFSLV